MKAIRTAQTCIRCGATFYLSKTSSYETRAYRCCSQQCAGKENGSRVALKKNEKIISAGGIPGQQDICPRCNRLLAMHEFISPNGMKQGWCCQCRREYQLDYQSRYREIKR